ncbi:hypothetical protein GC163_16555 [bacterium]|nr:hypothetical protein [bacterium]
MTHSSSTSLRSGALQCVELECRIPERRLRRLRMDYDDFLIGRAEFCDLRLDDTDSPLVLAELHRQADVLWIESAEDGHPLTINGQGCQRLALRDGDVLTIGNGTIEICIDRMPSFGTQSASLDEDLSALSADELCERIIAEQSEVDEFERKELEGWKSLVIALEQTLAEAQTQGGRVAQERIDGAITELRQLSVTLQSRADELLAREADFLETTAELRVAQTEMVQKLDLLLQQFDEGELRASA